MKSFIIEGISGVGKTIIIQNMLKKLNQFGYSFKPNTILGDVFNFSDKNKASVNISAMMNDDSNNADPAARKFKIEDYGKAKS